MTEDFSIFQNISLWCAFCAWLIAQLIKFMFSSVRLRKVDFRSLVSLGGVPSSHSAMASGLATSVGLIAGFSSPVFAVTLAFAAIVMFDAQTVRRAAGVQARLLNQIVEELFKEHHLYKERLAELLGHTPLEVFLGMALGIFTALLVHSHWVIFD